MIPWLESADAFPPLELALKEPNGLLCAGGDLSPQRLLLAYRQGIFPWYCPGEPILWWSPDPRMVLHTHRFRLHRSLRKAIERFCRTPGCEVRIDTAFDAVIHACAHAPRPGQSGTWIVPAMQQVYHDWHLAGRAHSIETWINGTLAGGLYGVQLGRFFFGESMFSRHTDASKIALVYLVRFLQAQGIEHIDCQQETGHLHSLGARPIPRSQFLGLLRDTMTHPDLHWTHGQLLHDGTLRPTA